MFPGDAAHIWGMHGTIPGFDVARLSRHRYERGGDYLDVFRPSSGLMAVAVGDVAGHDADSARIRAAARRLLRQGESEAVPGRLAELAGALNRGLAREIAGGRFMTLFLAVLAAARRSVHWVSAGHGHALAWEPGAARFHEMSGPDIPLGIDPAWRFHELSHRGWDPGALLLIATDGVWEARDPSGELYGQERLCRAVRAAAGSGASGIVAAIAADLEAFRAGRPQEDDLSLVVVKAV